MEINEYHGVYNIGQRSENVKYIVCHYVGNGDSSPGNALNNCKYFAGGDRGSSAHYFVDDGGIWEYANPSEYYTWHCGDGHGAYGITNRNSVGIEVCIDGDTPYTETEIGYLTELVGYLMDRFDVPADRVVRHYDASRKACPYFYTPYGSGGDRAWNELWQRITSGTKPEKVNDLQYVNNSGGNVYRLYNPDGFHHYTLSEAERDGLVAAGWNYEGVAWKAPKSAELAVYRMYDKNSGDHYYSASFDECSGLQEIGWRYEGVPWFSVPNGTPVYCVYNSNTGEHFYTTARGEVDMLVGQGWRDQGAAFNV